MTRITLPELARLAAFDGDFDAARYVLRWYADIKGWSDETVRARWDGSSALLGWWHDLPAPERPPLDDLSEGDARAFIAELETRGLARTTVKGYRSGASALTKALRAARTLPPLSDESHNPFKSVRPEPEKNAPVRIDERRLRALPSLPRARLELLVVLMDLGLSVPEACTRCRRDLDRERRFVVGYKGRAVTLGARAVAALERLERLRPGRRPFEKLLGWNADTARGWLKRVKTGG